MRIIAEWRARRRTRTLTSGQAVVLDLSKPKREPRGISSVFNNSAESKSVCTQKGTTAYSKRVPWASRWVGGWVGE
jgi:hypothetical protein